MARKLAIALSLLGLTGAATTVLADSLSCEVKAVEKHTVILDCAAKVEDRIKARDQVKITVDYPPPPMPPFPGAICGPPDK